MKNWLRNGPSLKKKEKLHVWYVILKLTTTYNSRKLTVPEEIIRLKYKGIIQSKNKISF